MEKREKELGVSFTGHRYVEKNFDLKKLEKAIENQIKLGKKYFYVGMALGFDSIAFRSLEYFRKKYDIKIIACVPCIEQDKFFTIPEKEEYKRMLSSANEVVYVSENYNKYCMMKRNRYMVDNSIYLIAYLRKETGGTASTVRYAKKIGVETEII